MQVYLATEIKILLQKALYRKQREIIKLRGIEMTTAMVPENNKSTINYYLKEGWVELDKKELLEFIKGRDMQCHVEDINTLVDDFPEEGHPSRAKVLKFITT